MKKLSICVPQYKETEEVIKPLLDSIAIQQNIDFKDIEVVIANDGSDTKLSEDFLRKYPYEIKYIQGEHKGVSATRNLAFDNATGEYIMFCDADDCFFNVIGIWFLFREMANGEFDSLTSVFMEESRIPPNKEIGYIERGRAEQGGVDSTFVHGKVHRRQYLIDANIRWDEDLTIHEDSYFNCLAIKCTSPERVKYCPFPFYLWKWRDESVCRHDLKYILKTMVNMILSNTKLVRQLLLRGKRKDAEFYCTSLIYDCYLLMNKDEWLNQENKEYRDNTELKFKEYYLEFKHLFESCEDKVKNQIYFMVKNSKMHEGVFTEEQTFGQWIKHIENLGGNENVSTREN